MSTDTLPARVNGQAAHYEAPAPSAYRVSDIQAMAAQIARSRLFGMDEAQAFTLMLLAHSKGLHPVQAVERYHVIQGKPAMKADAMLAEFQSRGGTVEWRRHDHEAVEAVFEAPGVKTPTTVGWTLADAKKAELTRNPMWTKYPRQMLRARVISEGIRMVMPGILSGIYTPEEVSDFAPAADPSPSLPPPDAHHARHHDNATGHGSGAYAPPMDVDGYRTWLKQFVETVNAKWLDRWTDGHGEVAEGVKELVNPWQLSAHLLKWARSLPDGHVCRINAPEDARTRQVDPLVAVAFVRGEGPVTDEARRYCKGLWREAEAALLPPEPEDAPDPEPYDDGDPDCELHVPGEREPGED